jgi:hypothetical protein
MFKRYDYFFAKEAHFIDPERHGGEDNVKARRVTARVRV